MGSRLLFSSLLAVEAAEVEQAAACWSRPPAGKTTLLLLNLYVLNYKPKMRAANVHQISWSLASSSLLLAFFWRAPCSRLLSAALFHLTLSRFDPA